ncbi:MAG: peptidoglycan-binding protein, partial [Candidatus Wolfebacteria bacterium]|nr:peptidoglycan-binding protein [Candidatus Wolfebacteria bacterium]
MKRIFFVLFLSIFIYFISIFISSGISFAATEFVSTILQSGGDYNTLSSWEAAINTDLTVATTKVFSGSVTGVIADGATTTLWRNSTSTGITGISKHDTATQILVASISSSTYSFQINDQWRVTASTTNYFQISDTGDSVIATAKIDGAWTSPDTTVVGINGWTTTSTNYIRIYTTPTARHTGKWDTNKYRLIATDSIPIDVYEDYVRLDGLQVQTIDPTANSRNIIVYKSVSAANESWLSNSILRGHMNSTYLQAGMNVNTENLVLKVWNVIGYDIYPSTTNGSFLWTYRNQSTGSISIYNSTFIGGYAGLDNPGSTPFIVKNTYLGGIGTYGRALYRGITQTTNAASDNTAADASLDDIAVNTTNFTNVTPGSEDFHLPVGSALIDVGTDTSGDTAPLNFTDDIDGQTRPWGSAWDIGADEFINTNPNAPASIGQYQSDCSSSISTSTYWISTSTVCFSGLVSDTDINDLEKLQIELSTSTFSNTPNYTASTFTTSTATSSANATATSSITVSSLPDGNYKWQARLLDYSNGTSSFTQFNSGSNSFGIDIVAPTGTIASSTFGTITSSSIIINRPSTSTITESGSGLYQWQVRKNSTTTLSAVSTSTATTSDSSLTSNTQYAYDVRFIDLAGNISSYGATSSKYTLTPDPTNFSATPSQTSIALSVDSFNNTSSASSSYYFLNTTNSNNSGWITTNSYTDTGLTCNTSYSYEVKYRNGDSTESATSSLSQTTSACSVSAAVASAGLPISILSSAKAPISSPNINKYPPVSTNIPVSQYPSMSFTKHLYPGLTNPEVKNLQSFLSQYPDIYPEKLITGYYGQLTKQAIQKLQLKYNITNKSDPAYGQV